VKVFIAEDADHVRQRIIKMLSPIANIRVVGEGQGVAESISLIRKQNPDIVLLDIRFPDGTGFEILEEIQNSDISPLTIVLTNYASHQFRKKSKQLGAHHFFDKSTEFEKAIHLIEQYSTASAETR
jgi:DNA-binding NarL/FixJ family response regulator